jgi:hypothetical protein
LMSAWIIILVSWVSVLLLILHDATKDDGAGSAISLSAKRFQAGIDWALKARSLRKTTASEPSANVERAVGNSSSLLKPVQSGAPPVIERGLAARKKKSWRRGGRFSATIPELELAIAEAVKKAAPECEEFVGVVLQQTTPRSRFGVNWQLRGVRFGNADRTIANEALTAIVESMQREYYLSEH